MASSAPSRDMTETVCQSPHCSDPHKDPKLLPCLHRYCKVYLASVMKSASEGMFKCSVCNQDCKFPKMDVDIFKTDLHMTNKLSLIKLQDSVENKHQSLLCGSCSEESTTPAYCFKCDTFLCQHCFQEHPEKFQDHQPHTLKLETIKEKNLTLENLKPFTDPMCAVHTTERAQLCCYKCGGVPICVKCVTSKHKGHNLRDVVELAECEKKLSEKMVSSIDKQEEKLHMIPCWAEAKKLRIYHKRTKNERERERMVRDLASSRDKAKNKLRSKFEEDMKKLDQKYDQESKEVGAKYDKIKVDCEKELSNVEQIERKTLKSMQLVQNPEGIIDICKQLINKNEDIKATTSSILDSKDLWSYAQCLPIIRDANKLLVSRMENALREHKILKNGTFKCGEAHKCLCCTNYLVESKQFISHITEKTYETEGYITCKTFNVIYLIHCSKCKVQYVGETTDTLSNRFSRHQSEVNSKNKTKNISGIVAHFKAVGHSANHMRIRGIKSFIFPDDMLTEEKEWMEELGTMSPQGLNVK